jgi:hypothetical protein
VTTTTAALGPLVDRIAVAGSDECWLWLGRVDRHGYGRTGSDLAHRRVYERLVGPIPDELELDHLCRVITCVNPSHLETVTKAENLRRKGAAVTTCANGHPYNDENTYHRPNGQRGCRPCIAERTRQYRARRKSTATSQPRSRSATA